MGRKFLVADDETAALNQLIRTIRGVDSESETRGVTNPEEALALVINQGFLPDIAFLDIQMYGMNGIELAKRLKEASPYTKIVFVTAYSEYALEAFTIHASGYLLKPALPEKVLEEMECLNEVTKTRRKRIFIQTFGNFEVFADEVPVAFRRSKSKEILAYLVDRKGVGVTKKEIAAILWEGAEYTRNSQIYLQTLIAELIRALGVVGAEEIVRKRHNSYSVDPSKFDCDFYQFEKWDMEAINAYHGEYMSNYSWAEFTIGYLEEKKKRWS